MAPFFDDPFNGAGSTTELSAWAPTVGDSWTKIWATSTQVFQVITGGTVRGSQNAGDVGFMYTADATYPSANYEVQITFLTTNSTTEPLYILARLADQENMYALRLVLAAGSNNAQLYKKVAGSWSTLGSAVTIADGSVVVLRVNGTDIEVDDDGVNVISESDSDLSAAGKAGMAHGGGAELVTSTDNTRAAAMVDNFSVTDLGGGGVTYTTTGAGVSPHVAGGSDEVIASEAGLGVSPHAAAGADEFVASESGAGSTPATAAGSDQVTTTETGAGFAPAVATGADQVEWTETATAVSTFGASGASEYIPASGAQVYEKTGGAAATAQASGADQFTATETGAGVSPAAAAGASASGAGGGMGSWVPFADLYDAQELARVKINRGEPHPELNLPRLARERAEREADEDALLLMVTL